MPFLTMDKTAITPTDAMMPLQPTVLIDTAAHTTTTIIITTTTTTM